MKIFVTGGSGYIGTSVIPVLTDAGHSVLALARSQNSAAKLAAMNNVEVIEGDLTNIEVLKKAASESDAVIHLAFIHDFSNPALSLLVDLAAITAIGEALEGTGKAFVGTGVFGSYADIPGTFTESFRSTRVEKPRVGLEVALLALEVVGVRSLVVRLPFAVHGLEKMGFVPMYVNILKNLGVAEYVGDGQNKWPAVNVADAAVLYKLVVENGKAGSVYHGISEEGIEFKKIAEETAKGLEIVSKSVGGDQAQQDYQFLGIFSQMDVVAVNEETKKELGWKPVHSLLMEDIREHYT